MHNRHCIRLSTLTNSRHPAALVALTIVSFFFTTLTVGRRRTVKPAHPNVTEREQTEKRPLDSAERLHSIIQTVLEGIITIDDKGAIQTLNLAVENMFGYDAQELIGRNIRILMPEPYHAEHDGYIHNYLETGHRKIIGIGREVMGRRKDGSVFPMHLAVSEFWQGEQRYFTGAIRDITEYRRAEQEREALLERERLARNKAERNAEHISRMLRLAAALAGASTPSEIAGIVVEQGAASIGASGGAIALVNPAYTEVELLAMSGLSQELADSWRASPTSALAALAEAVRSREPVWIESREAHLERYPGSACPWGDYGASAVIPMSMSGSVFGAVLMCFAEAHTFEEDERDLLVAVAQQCAQALERARLYAAELEARSAAEAAVKLRDHFISVASHELKTPLTSIKGYAELLSKRGAQAHLDPQFQRMADIIDAQAGRLEKMIAAMLDISRIERGQLSLELGSVDIEMLAQRIADEVRSTLHHHTLSLASVGERLIVRGDASRLEQVLSNLFQNAIKYSPLGGPISVQLSREDGMARIAISDKGIGIPAEDLPHLFSRFHRARNAEANHINGLGIGLYVVREIVHLHGGEIKVESREGQGSTFLVTLPLEPNAKLTVRRERARMHQQLQSIVSCSGARVTS